MIATNDDADEDRARDDARRIPDFVADVADVVVAQVVVDADPRRRAEPDEETHREVERAGREIERHAGIEVSTPVTMTAAVVSRLPTQSVTVSGPSEPIGRYSRARFSTPTAAAISAKVAASRATARDSRGTAQTRCSPRQSPADRSG